ncbi:hypothetical protein E4U19_002704 [Claviceps sp. Clav32 group G5]|nr:hypothetical protein E4U19_002704 [Claviceps sp. Clav32 group G5]KAG6042905.1 hypothetical protein E4U39_005283 [Claviceps sp. Clav50 group G5]
MHILAASAACLAATAAAASCPRPPSSSSSSFATTMLDSIISRQQGRLSDSGAASSTLESGILAQAIEAVIAQHPHTKSRYAQYLSDVLDVASAPTKKLTNSTTASLRPLDRFSLATAIQSALDSGIAPVTSQSLQARDAIHASLAIQKRNPDHGLWYYVYPEWSYLDGVFSLLPYMASQPQPDHQDMMLQIRLLSEHCTQPNTSLPVHGYDWSRKAVWADRNTGASPYVWGRPLGWFIAGLVQTWDQLSCHHQHHAADKTGAGTGNANANANAYDQLCQLIQEQTSHISAALLKYADPETGAWWQIVTLPGQKGNYLESSSTALFIFSYLKAVRTGLLSGGDDAAGEAYKRAALKAYEYTNRVFVTKSAGNGNGNGTVGFDKTVAVCSLNSTATYEYYVKQPLSPNSLLGESAYILASLEVERLR